MDCSCIPSLFLEKSENQLQDSYRGLSLNEVSKDSYFQLMQETFAGNRVSSSKSPRLLAWWIKVRLRVK
jgi:hypothetical protein